MVGCVREGADPGACGRHIAWRRHAGGAALHRDIGNAGHGRGGSHRIARRRPDENRPCKCESVSCRQRRKCTGRRFDRTPNSSRRRRGSLVHNNFPGKPVGNAVPMNLIRISTRYVWRSNTLSMVDGVTLERLFMATVGLRNWGKSVAIDELPVNNGRPDGDALDAELLAAALRNRSQFAVLYHRYQLPVYSYCRRRLDEQDAEDATSHIF